MDKNQQLDTLGGILDKIEDSIKDCDSVSLRKIIQVIGHRSFGPLLLIAGLITLAPLVGDIPGVPTIIGVLVFLVSVQLLLQKEHIWLPKWLLSRSITQQKASKAMNWMRRPTKFIDRWLRPRLNIFIEGFAFYVLAVVCVLIAIAMPVMELVPSAPIWLALL